jgi:hypothetical protein
MIITNGRDPAIILKDMGNLALYLLMSNTEAMKASQMLNFNGFKRKHRYRSHQYFDIMQALQCYSFCYSGENIKLDSPELVYNPLTLKEHLIFMVKDTNDKLKQIGALNMEFNVSTGFDCGKAECIKKILLEDMIKFKRWLDKFNKVEWNESVMNEVDMHIHEKYKAKEND